MIEIELQKDKYQLNLNMTKIKNDEAIKFNQNEEKIKYLN